VIVAGVSGITMEEHKESEHKESATEGKVCGNEKNKELCEDMAREDSNRRTVCTDARMITWTTMLESAMLW
jgi:hypothetical protein